MKHFSLSMCSFLFVSCVLKWESFDNCRVNLVARYLLVAVERSPNAEYRNETRLSYKVLREAVTILMFCPVSSSQCEFVHRSQMAWIPKTRAPGSFSSLS